MDTQTYSFTSTLITSYDTTTLHPWTKELETTCKFNYNRVSKMTLKDFNTLASAS